MSKKSENFIVHEERPAQIFDRFGQIQPRVPESNTLYQGNPDLVPDLMRYIFRDENKRPINFSELNPPQVYLELKKANTRLRTLSLIDFEDQTAATVRDTLSMAYRTSHPLSFGRLKQEITNTLKDKKPKDGRLSFLDLGYGPGTLSMAQYTIAKDLGFKPYLLGVDLSPVHRAIAKHLYSNPNYRVDWTVGDATKLVGCECYTVGTAYDIGHHLSLPQYQRMVFGLLNNITNDILTTDPTNLKFPQKIVDIITTEDPIHAEAVASYQAAYSRRDLEKMYREVTPDNWQTTLIDTGFKNIIHIRRVV